MPFREIELDGRKGYFIPKDMFPAELAFELPVRATPAPVRARPGSVRAKAIAVALFVLRDCPPGTMLSPKEILNRHDRLSWRDIDQHTFLPEDKNRLYRLGKELWVESERRDAQISRPAPKLYALPLPICTEADA
jgi:hypothetical protein